MQTEIWKDIPLYIGRYMVSNFGKVLSLNYRHTKKSKILKSATSRKGYERVLLCNDSGKKNFSVHRLVAITFLENPFNNPQINHINGIKTDNRLDNLEWCTALENQMHAIRTGLKVGCSGEKNGMYGTKGSLSPAYRNKYSVGRSGKLHINSKPVIQYSVDGKHIHIYESTCIAMKETGVDISSISRACRGIQKQAGGFKWGYQ